MADAVLEGKAGIQTAVPTEVVESKGDTEAEAAPTDKPDAEPMIFLPNED